MHKTSRRPVRSLERLHGCVLGGPVVHPEVPARYRRALGGVTVDDDIMAFPSALRLAGVPEMSMNCF
jgi:hypothetical protein